jgi:hypothetical protein
MVILFLTFKFNTMSTEEKQLFDAQLTVDHLSYKLVVEKYKRHANDYPIKIENQKTIGQNLRYAEINELLQPLYRLSEKYARMRDNIFSKFINSLDKEMNDLTNVNLEYEIISKIYGTDMAWVEMERIALENEKAEVEERWRG